MVVLFISFYKSLVPYHFVFYYNPDIVNALAQVVYGYPDETGAGGKSKFMKCPPRCILNKNCYYAGYEGVTVVLQV